MRLPDVSTPTGNAGARSGRPGSIPDPVAYDPLQELERRLEYLAEHFFESGEQSHNVVTAMRLEHGFLAITDGRSILVSDSPALEPVVVPYSDVADMKV